ncbi:MAG: DNA translocase FtsK 4TM domain-containing protein, partial [Dechloromonas agitata]|nr:DNA translocase FtsK 4TM domain-containing protein [Dechloromonas agitata]
MARMAKAATAPSPLPEKIGNLLQESRWLGVGAVALFLILALWGFDKEDPGWSHAVVSSSLHNPTGRAGAWIADLMLYVFGLSAWWWVVLLGMFVWWGVRKFNAPEAHRQHPLLIALGGFLFLLLASCSLEALRFYSMQAELPLAPGGMLGIELGGVLAKQLGYTGSTLFLLAAMAVGWS